MNMLPGREKDVPKNSKIVYFKASLFDMFLLHEESPITKHEWKIHWCVRKECLCPN